MAKPVVYRSGCYICRDSEFAQMGLPLCYLCKFCKGHVPADNIICDDCGRNQGDTVQTVPIDVPLVGGVTVPFRIITYMELECQYCGHLPCGCGG